MRNSRLTVFLLVLCFALWGVVNNMSDNLVPAFQRIFTMDQDRAVLVQVAFYGAYAVLALFTSILVEEFSFRTGILIGLAVYVCGALLYIPACLRQSFDFYFIGIFVVAGGCAILEASSNSCILAIGEAKSAIRRLNFAQAMNPVGSIVGIFIAQKAILAHLNPATVEERLAMTPEQLRPIVHAELTWICVPYVALCLVMLAIWVYFLRHPIVTEMEGGSRQLAPLRTRCMHVGAAILATALPFVLTGILFPNMDKLAWMLCGMIGPFSCILALPSYRASFLALVRTPRYVFGIIALFAYVGMQIAVWTAERTRRRAGCLGKLLHPRDSDPHRELLGGNMGHEVDRPVEDHGDLLRLRLPLLHGDHLSAVCGALHRLRSALLGQHPRAHGDQPLHGDSVPHDLRHGPRRTQPEVLQARRSGHDHGHPRRCGGDAVDGGRHQREGKRLLRPRADDGLHMGRQPAHFVRRAPRLVLRSGDLLCRDVRLSCGLPRNSTFFAAIVPTEH